MRWKSAEIHARVSSILPFEPKKNAIGRKIFADYGPEMDVKWQLVQSIGKILQRDKFAAVDEISQLKLSRNYCLRLLAEQKLLLKDNIELPTQDEFFI